jgi:hypothetical protein
LSSSPTVQRQTDAYNNPSNTKEAGGSLIAFQTQWVDSCNIAYPLDVRKKNIYTITSAK